MTTLREAATIALEAMLNFPDDISDEMFESITALKAALAEDAMQKFTDVNQELEAAPQEDHFCDTHCTWADHAPGCVRSDSVQEPVAWIHVPHPGNGMSQTVSLSPQREPSMYAASVPLFLKEKL